MGLEHGAVPVTARSERRSQMDALLVVIMGRFPPARVGVDVPRSRRSRTHARPSTDTRGQGHLAIAPVVVIQAVDVVRSSYLAYTTR
jgi:hypothetical protein